MSERYELLKKFVQNMNRPSDPLDKAAQSGIRIVPSMKELEVVMDNPMLSDDTKHDLSNLLRDRPKLCYLILDIIENTSGIIGNCINTREIKLYWPWSMHQLENIFVYQNTFPKMLEEPMHLLGYDRFIQLPLNFRIGLLIHLDFYAKDSDGHDHSTISVGNLWCGYEQEGNVLVSHNTCILVP